MMTQLTYTVLQSRKNFLACWALILLSALPPNSHCIKSSYWPYSSHHTQTRKDHLHQERCLPFLFQLMMMITVAWHLSALSVASPAWWMVHLSLKMIWHMVEMVSGFQWLHHHTSHHSIHWPHFYLHINWPPFTHYHIHKPLPTVLASPIYRLSLSFMPQ